MVLLLPECVVCVSEFDDDSAVPRVLTSCGHSLCATCITALAAPWTLPSSASASSSALIPPSGPASALPSASAPAASAPSAAAANATSLIVRCPECSVRSRSANGRVDGFPKNIELLRLLHAIRSSSRTETTAVTDADIKTLAENGNDVSGARQNSRLRSSSRRGCFRHAKLGLVTGRESSHTRCGDTSTPQQAPICDNSGDSKFRKYQSEREWLLGRTAGTDHRAAIDARIKEGGCDNEGRVEDEADDTGGDNNEAGGQQGRNTERDNCEGGEAHRNEIKDGPGRSGLEDQGSGSVDEGSGSNVVKSELDGASEMVMLREVAAHRDNVTAVAVTSDSSLLFTASFDKTVRMWSLPDASLLHTLSGPAHRITALTLANTAAPRGASAAISYGHLLVCGDYGGSFHAWDISQSLPPPSPLASTHPFLPPTVSSSLPSAPPLPSCPSFLVSSAPALPTNPTHPTSTPHLVTTSVTAPVPAPHLVTTSVTAPVTAPHLVTTWSEEKDWRYSGVLSLAAPQPGDYSEDGGAAAASGGCNEYVVYSGSGDRTVKAWAPNADGSFSLLARMEGHTAPVSSLQVDSQVVVSGSWDGTIRLWWRPDHSPMAVLVCRSLTTSTRALGSSMGLGQGAGMGVQGVGASASGSASVGVNVSVRAVVVEEEGDLILCAREDGRVEVWHGSSSIMLLTPNHAMPVTSGNSGSSSSSSSVSSASTTGTTTVTGPTATTTDASSPPPALLSLAVCRPLLAAGAADGSIMLWHMHGYGADVSITPWRQLSHAQPQSHIQGPCTALAFAPSDAAAAAATEVTTGHGSSGWRDDLAASLLLLSGGFDGRLCVWEGKVAGSVTGRV